MTELLTQATPGPQPRRVDSPELVAQVDDLIAQCGGNITTREGRLVRDLMLTSLKLITDRSNTGELKLLTHSFKEMRHAFRVFADYRDTPKISIFGSARTPADHPDYQAAVRFSRLMADRGWLVITGAGDGIMKAGHEGPGADSSFGLAIRLPFETTANSVIAGDDKLLHFRYFFTRKLMFLSQCQAITAFPGGFGTQDELLEALTLIQTGKSAIVPVVLIEGDQSDYWQQWEAYVREEFLKGGFISPDDLALYHLAPTPEDAAQHVSRFYANYHSSRYVGDDLVLRIRHPLTDQQLMQINLDFAGLVQSGHIHQGSAYGIEDDHLELTRIAFHHTRRGYGTVRRLIDRLNDYAITGAADSTS